MNKEIFEQIKQELETRISKCKEFLGTIETTDDLKKLTIEQAQQLQRFSKEEESRMTKMVQCDLYHIIGMGDLTPPQMMKFTYLIRDYLQYRSTIKTIAMNFDKISTLPSITVSAIYKTHCFNGLTLSSNSTDICLDMASEVPYALASDMIKVSQNKVDEFISFWSKKVKVPFSKSNFCSKAKAGAEYGGVRWTIDNSGDFIGIIITDSTRALFEGCYKYAQENF